LKWRLKVIRREFMEEKEARRENSPEPGGREGAADEILEKVLRRRERHRERSLPVRAGVVIAGSAVSLFAALLSVITPEFGLPLLLFGLRILALEFDWAARLYTKVAKLAKKVAGSLRKLWPKSKAGAAMALLALVAAFVAVFVLLG